MAWITMVLPDEATGELKRQYEAAEGRAGYVAHILRIQSLNPATLRASMDLYKATMFGASGLTRTEREMLATVVSQVNDCYY